MNRKFVYYIIFAISFLLFSIVQDYIRPNYDGANETIIYLLGAAFLSWMAIPLTAFEYSKGNPKKLISSSQGTRYFCQDCGTPLSCLLDEYPKYIYVTICSLDNPQDFEPSGDIYVEDMLDWVKT